MNTRRAFLATAAATAASTLFAAQKQPLRWLIASSLYGTETLDTLLPQLTALGVRDLDIWPRRHGDQREQADALGREKFADLLARHGIRLACSTRYDLGPLKIGDEIPWLARFGGKTIVTGSTGPKGLTGEDLKKAVAIFAEQLKPIAETARAAGITLAIENHGNALIESPDSIRWLHELAPPGTGIALAPYHLEQTPELWAELIRTLGPRLAVFYGWQHGKGSTQPQPKDDELLQLPGRGPVDFTAPMRAILTHAPDAWISPFMHPFPRGLPIMPTTPESTAEIRRAMQTLERASYDKTADTAQHPADKN